MNEDAKVRFSFTTGISRPTYQEARASATIDPTNRVIAYGNPDLEEGIFMGLDAFA